MSFEVEFSGQIQPSAKMEAICRDILPRMFPDYQRVIVKKRFEGGFSGSWVFLVHLIRDERPELPVVVKIASIALINKEWEGYDQHIRGKWPAAAPIRDQPVDDGTYSGLCYSLVGGGVFRVESLCHYCLAETTRVEDIEAVFSRLALVLKYGLCFREKISGYRLWATYDPLLPFNLLIKAVSDAPKEELIWIAPNALPKEAIQANSYVCLKEFEIVKVNLKKCDITLNLPRPTSANRLPTHSYYVCVQFESIEEMSAYKAGQTIPMINARVVQTRDEKWQKELEHLLPSFDLAAETVSLSDGTDLPNPLAALKRIRDNDYDVQVDYIHGDLNLENVLVDPEVRDVRLIDFGLVRRDHVLHDFLRLEAGIVTKVLPSALLKAGLPAQHIYEFYQQLHYATFHSKPIRATQSPSPTPGLEEKGGALEKPFAILKAVRKMARDHGLFNPNKYEEYYDCLTLYLLGTLKFGDLNRTLEDPKPWPKEIAFWGAATAQGLLATLLWDADCLRYQVEPLDGENMKNKRFVQLFNRYLSELKRPPSWLIDLYNVAPTTRQTSLPLASSHHFRAPASPENRTP